MTEKKLSLKSLSQRLDESDAKTDKMVGLLEHLVNKDKTIGQTFDKEESSKELEAPTVDEAGPKEIPVANGNLELLGAELEIFNKYFEVADGFTAHLNSDKTEFTIVVPMKFSNMSDAHKSFYKDDLRTKKVDQNNLLGSIENWCKLVCQNLKYNKKYQFKT